jgi:predicted RNA polymerase sigma factor
VTDAPAVQTVIAEAHRREWALVLAATVRLSRDLDLAEECVQEAYASALETWVRSGIPRNPAAWLTTTAKRRAIDAMRAMRPCVRGCHCWWSPKKQQTRSSCRN